MRRLKRKKQKKIIIISSLALLLFLCVGYAAFQTNLSITAKGNIKSIDITDSIVAEGDGLYKDQYEENRYIYRGQKPDNYILFNEELWRIIAKEADGTYKIIRNDTLQNRVYDEVNHRSTANNSFCLYPQIGCAVYAAISGEFSTPSGSQKGTVTEDSSIKLYLNNEYYVNNINEIAKNQITSHTFNIGGVERLNNSSNDSIEKNIAGEKMYTWDGNVGLANVSDILRASINPLCTSATSSWDNAEYGDITFCNNNYLLNNDDSEGTYFWLINPYNLESHSNSRGVWFASMRTSHPYVSYGDVNELFAPRPVVFLKSSVKLTGHGTKTSPFQILENTSN